MDLLRIFFFCLIWLFVAQPAQSQVTVAPSKTKVVIDGKSFYLHTVKPGETLYSISRAYNVLQRDVVFNNPDAFEGIKIGQELKIPAEANVTPTGNQLQSAQYIYHITEKGQTVYWLTQNYNLSQEELFKYNPELEHSELQAGQVVTIPKKTNGTVAPPETKPAFVVHTVKRGETLFSIAKSYNVDLNRVFEINPEIDVNNSKVKVGQQVKMPLSNAVPISLPVEVSKADTIIIRQDLQTNNNGLMPPSPYTAFIMDNNSECAETSQNDFRIAMFLPWFLADNAPASAPDSGLVKANESRFRYRDGRYWVNPQTTNALDFYMGALLAVDSLRKQGVNIKLSVFDTMRDTIKMAQLLKSSELKNMDLIIGPFYTELVNQVAPFALENRIYYVSPISINAESLKNNPYLMQVNTGEINTVGTVVNHISTQENIHVTLIGNRLEADQTLFNAYLGRLKTTFDEADLTIHQMRPDSLQPTSRYLKRGKTNVVIIPSANETFVNIITGKLHEASNSIRINLYGLSSWIKFLNLDLEYFHALEFSYATAFYIDYNNTSVKDFLQQYRKMYHTEPTLLTGLGSISPNAYQFAFLGYDITYYFASVLKKYGKEFGRCITDFRMPMLQSDFRFEKIDPFSGYMNKQLNIYKYGKDYYITKE
jgi:LysM repeat protein